MKGLMMSYPLTMDRILEHANRVYPEKRSTPGLPAGPCTSTPTRICTSG